MSAATEGFSAMIRDFTWASGGEERLIVPKVRKPPQGDDWSTLARDAASRGTPTQTARARESAPATRTFSAAMRCQRPPGSGAILPSTSSIVSAPTTRAAGSAARATRVSTSMGSWPSAARTARLSEGSAVESVVDPWPAAAVCAPTLTSGSRSSSSTSCAVSTSLAPSRISLWQPRENGEWIDPGMAKRSRPCSPAMRAVMSEPDETVASTTSTPRARPLMIRLRRGKFPASGGVPARIRSRRVPQPRSRGRGPGSARDRPGRAPCRSRRSCRLRPVVRPCARPHRCPARGR